MVSLGCDKLVDHVHGAGKQNLDIGIAGGKADAFGQKGFSGSRVADEDHIHALFDKRQI